MTMHQAETQMGIIVLGFLLFIIIALVSCVAWVLL